MAARTAREVDRMHESKPKRTVKTARTDAIRFAMISLLVQGAMAAT